MTHEIKVDPNKLSKMIDGIIRHYVTIDEIRIADELVFLSGHKKAVFVVTYVEFKDIYAIASIKLQEWLSPDTA